MFNGAINNNERTNLLPKESATIPLQKSGYHQGWVGSTLFNGVVCLVSGSAGAYFFSKEGPGERTLVCAAIAVPSLANVLHGVIGWRKTSLVHIPQNDLKEAEGLVKCQYLSYLIVDPNSNQELSRLKVMNAQLSNQVKILAGIDQTVESLREEKAILQNQLTTANKTIPQLTGHLTEQTSTINLKETEIEGLRKTITTLEYQITQLEARKNEYKDHYNEAYKTVEACGAREEVFQEKNEELTVLKISIQDATDALNELYLSLGQNGSKAAPIVEGNIPQATQQLFDMLNQVIIRASALRYKGSSRASSRAATPFSSPVKPNLSMASLRVSGTLSKREAIELSDDE